MASHAHSSEEPDEHDCARDDAPENILAFDQVTFGYNRTPVLREASLRVDAREFVALVGANGAGKTTMMLLALGLLEPSHGTVRLFGQPVDSFKQWGLVGYVPQRAATNMVLPVSVEEVVRTGLAGHLGLFRRPKAHHRARMEHVLHLLGIANLRRQPLHELSGGQAQRTLIARALVTQPRLLILDEPTTGVDADARRVLREALEHLVVTEGVGVVYISHDPEGFGGLADRVVEVRAGRAHLIVPGSEERVPHEPGDEHHTETLRGGARDPEDPTWRR